MATDEEAFEVLVKWMSESGSSAEESRIEDWRVSRHEGAVVFAPDKRSNTVYLVEGDKVVFYMPSSETFEDAYARLVSE
jgi:hypothetical protein